MVEDYHSFNEKQAKLGQLLFYDKILSGNRNIACSTCHHPNFGTSDGLSLGIGEGGEGLGPNRKPVDVQKRIPRNAQALWNLGHKSVHVLFHDGRLSNSTLFQNGFNSPAEEWLPSNFQTILAAQAIFPMISQFEMAGNVGENEIIGAVNDRIDYAWPLLAQRVSAISEYAEHFQAAFPDIKTAADIEITHIGIALGEFINSEWRSLNSPYDLWVKGNYQLEEEALRGYALFKGKAGCIQCHSGPLLTDQKFHAIGVPIFGPGRTRQFDMVARDQGRINETDNLEDIYRFRTPSLRNVSLTAPYGHNGAFPDLKSIIIHHLNPKASLEAWQEEQANLPDIPWLSAQDFIIRSDEREMQRLIESIEIEPKKLSIEEIEDIIAFLNALTSPKENQSRLGIPNSVPSGLPID